MSRANVKLDRMDNEAAIELLEEWFSEPDEMGEEWWDEYEKDLEWRKADDI